MNKYTAYTATVYIFYEEIIDGNRLNLPNRGIIWGGWGPSSPQGERKKKKRKKKEEKEKKKK